jgi:hypothetical protein
VEEHRPADVYVRGSSRRAVVSFGVMLELLVDRIGIDRTKDEIKNSPEFDESMYRDESYRSQLGSYYYSDVDR